MEFKVGDIVEWQGVRGTVNCNTHYGVKVLFADGNIANFYADGRYFDWHKEPSLKLIERPKKMVKKTMTKWCNIYADGDVCVHSTRAGAESIAGARRIACIEKTFEWTEKVACIEETFEYEIEEE